MTTRPWMPLYVADYLADTAHLTAAEHGAYLLLIMHYWSKGGLPEDEAAIARITRLTARQWSQSRDVLWSLFGDNWRHKRIDEELGKAIEKSKVNSANAKRRHSERSTVAQRTHTQSQSQSDNPEANASGPPSAADRLWAEALPYLKTRMPETQARSVIGRWRKVTSDDCELVLGAIVRARELEIADPIAWVTAALKPKDQGYGKTKPSFSEIAREIGRSLAANGSDEAGGNVVGLLSDRRSA